VSLDGAALVYTSVKEKKNIEKLYKYLVHKCYDYPFVSPASIVERDAIFIPAGWDNPKKAEILLENLHRLKATDQYADVFVKPISRRVNFASHDRMTNLIVFCLAVAT
jgi:dynein light intermediate chain 1, cytosolic